MFSQIKPALPPLFAPPVAAPPEVVTFATAIVPSAVSILTGPPSCPTGLLVPVVTRSPAKFTVPVPNTSMSIAPDAPPAVNDVVVIVPCAVLLIVVPAVSVAFPSLVVIAASNCIDPAVAVSATSPETVVTTSSTLSVPVSAVTVTVRSAVSLTTPTSCARVAAPVPAAATVPIDRPVASV